MTRADARGIFDVLEDGPQDSIVRGEASMDRYGFSEPKWEAAKAEAKTVLAAYARRRQMIPYSEFVQEIHSIQLEHHDPRLFHFLGEISSEENAVGRGMLSALVVHKHGDYQPGPGFFELAAKLGRDTTDIVKCWIEEVKRVFAAWTE
ncbi:MAG TPA: hypothetical protein VGS20_01325 [Candidatus Acidoferrales bacterium]|nr:hypothetical protein [Candidatus Acidoferrales bacterium]